MYCVNCGVELADSETVCRCAGRGCSTPIFQDRRRTRPIRPIIM
ncbi:MAG: hypothetical protein V8T00_09680 [Oscillospiraceae bacterium]